MKPPSELEAAWPQKTTRWRHRPDQGRLPIQGRLRLRRRHRPDRGHRPLHQLRQEGGAVDPRLPTRPEDLLPRQSPCRRTGRRRISRTSISTRSAITSRRARSPSAPGTRCRMTSRRPSSASASRSRSASFSPASRPSSTPRPPTPTSRTSSPSRASSSSTPPRPPRAPGDLPQVLRQGHPDRRQQVLRAQQRRVLRRLVHLRAARA
jgi:hypothetical protein